MQAGTKEAKEPHVPVEDLGSYVVILACLGLIAMGKETATVTSVLLTVVGFVFGKHTRKARR